MNEMDISKGHVRLLEAVIEQQKALIQAQEARLAEKDAAIADLKKLVDELQSLKANLEETLEELRRQFFGTRSEKKTVSKEDKASDENARKIEVKSHTRERRSKTKREELYANLPVKDVIIPLSEEQQRCEYCNAQMTVIGYTTV